MRIWGRIYIALGRHKALLAYLAAYLIIATLVLPPTGEALITDDCDFALTVIDWVEEGRLRISDFPSMTLIGHLAWGWCFAELFGANIVVLRISTMLMAWLGGLSLYYLSLSHSKNHRLAAFAAGTYVFSPLLFYLSYTFNTDVSGCSMSLLFLAILHRIGCRPDMRSIVVLGLVGAWCLLIRQTAGIPALLFGIWLVYGWFRKTVVLTKVAVFWVLLLLPCLAYFYWLATVYGYPINYEKSFLDWTRLFLPSFLFERFLSLMLAFGLYLCPLGLWLGGVSLNLRRRTIAWWLGTAATAWALLYFDFLVGVRPFYAIDLHDCLLGKMPEVWGLEHLIPSPRFIFFGQSRSLFEAATVLIGTGSLSILANYVLSRRHDFLAGAARAWREGLNAGKLPFRAFIAVGFLSQVALLLLIDPLFDRYVLPALCFAIAFLACELPTTATRFKIAELSLGLLTAVSLLAFQDSLTQFEGAWKLGKRLESQGISPYNIWIGHQYYGARAYRPVFNAFLDKHEKRLAGIPPQLRVELSRWPISAQYQLRCVGPNEKPSGELPELKFQSWIREYHFEAFRMPIAEAYGDGFYEALKQ